MNNGNRLEIISDISEVVAFSLRNHGCSSKRLGAILGPINQRGSGLSLGSGPDSDGTGWYLTGACFTGLDSSLTMLGKVNTTKVMTVNKTSPIIFHLFPCINPPPEDFLKERD